MRNIFLLSFVLVSLFCEAHSQTFNTNATLFDEFNSIDLKGSFEVYISQGETCSIRVEGETRSQESVEAWVENGVLYVRAKKGGWGAGGAELHIQVMELNRIKSAGAVEMESVGILRSERLELDFAGAAEADLHIETREFKVEAKGACELTLIGSATYADFIAAGAVEIEASGFKTRSLGIETAGACELEVYVTDEMKVEASGATEVRYRGKPAHIHRKLKGASRLEAA